MENIITIKATVTSVTAPTVTMADFKFNKDIAFMCGFDDALINQYSHMFPLFTGGVSGMNGVNYPGLKYSDGTGAMVPFHATMVVPVGGLRVIDNEDNPASYSYVKLKQMVDAGFGINNHSYYHGGGDTPWDIVDTIKKAEQALFDYMGYRPIVGTTPASEFGYMYTFEILGYLLNNSTFNEGNAEMTRYGKIRPNDVPTSFFNLDRAYFGDNYTDSEAADSKRYIDEIYNDCDNGQKMMGNMFTHGPGEVNNFDSVYTYLLNHPKNTNKNRLWVPSVQEFFEYFHVKRNTVINQSVAGNQLTLTLDQTNVHPNIRNRSMSLLLKGLNLTSVTSITGADKFTFNAATGLINAYKVDGSATINPSSDVLPPQIKAVIAKGSGVNIYYDKPVTQSKMGAFTVSGKTVTGLTGSGNLWTVSLNSAPTSANKLTYKSHNGDAAAGGLRVADYPGFPIAPEGTTPPVTTDPPVIPDPSEGITKRFFGRRIIMLS